MSLLNLLKALIPSAKAAPAKAPEPAPAPRPLMAAAPAAAPAASKRLAREMRPSPAAFQIIKRFEGCCLRAYPDPASPLSNAMRSAGVLTAYKKGALQDIPSDLKKLSGAPWTIGWGQTGPSVKPGLAITQEQADAWLAKAVEDHCEPIRRLVTVPITQSTFDGLASFLYNVGGANFQKSSVLRLLNQGQLEAAANSMLLWNKAQGQILQGLVNRRSAERLLLLSK